MTTIAICREFIAADSLSTYDNTVFDRREIKIVPCLMGESVAYLAVSGNLHGSTKFLNKYKGRNVQHLEEEDGVDLENDAFVVCVTQSGIIYTLEAKTLYWIQYQQPFIAIGSGDTVATGCLAAGLNAIETVNITAKWDLRTGGDFIYSINYNTGVEKFHDFK